MQASTTKLQDLAARLNQINRELGQVPSLPRSRNIGDCRSLITSAHSKLANELAHPDHLADGSLGTPGHPDSAALEGGSGVEPAPAGVSELGVAAIPLSPSPELPLEPEPEVVPDGQGGSTTIVEGGVGQAAEPASPVEEPPSESDTPTTDPSIGL